MPEEIDLPSSSLGHRVVVEAEPWSCEPCLLVDDPRDSFLARCRCIAEEPLAHLLDEPVRWWPVLNTGTRRRRQQHEGSNPFLEVQRKELADHPAHRVTDDVGLLHVEVIEDRNGIRRQIIERVPGVNRIASARVPRVETYDRSGCRNETFDQFVGPATAWRLRG